MCFQIIALVVLALFYGCYFVKMAAQRRRGIRTNQMGRGKVGLPRIIEIALRAVTCLVPAAEVISIFLNTSPFPAFVRIIGACTAILGVTVFIISVLTMRDSWRAGVSKDEKTELVTNGIYQISRNPAFLGFDLVYLGILLMFFNWPLFLLSASAMVLLHLQIVNVEEEFLQEAFGEAYLHYKRQVFRYLGRSLRK